MSEPQWVSMMQPMTFESQAHVAKPGRHREFVMGQENPVKDFAPFLTAFLQASTAYTVPGGYQYCFHGLAP